MKNTNKTKYSILGILTIHPMTGYDIKKMIDNSIGHFWNESFGQLYPTLKKMEEEGYVTVNIENNGAKQRNLYSITDTGREFLKEWLVLSADSQQIRMESLLKIFFGFNVAPSQTIKHINEMRASYEENLTILKSIVANMECQNSPNNEHVFPMLTAQFGIMNYEANIKWADYALKTLESMK